LTDIKCPICRDRLSGRSPDDLNEVLRAHLADTHQITRISEENRLKTSSPKTEREMATWSGRDPALLTPEETRQREEVGMFYKPPLGSETKIEREVETFSGREPTGETPESASLIQKTNQWRYPRIETREEREVGTWRSESRYAPSEMDYRVRSETGEWRYPTMAEVSHGVGTMHRMLNRGELRMAMNCPLCGRPIYGSDDDDLSDEMRFHFKDYHSIRRR
jgi:predicted small metal-binding protein